MNNIICFILGIMFIVVFLPILQETSELICVMFESLKCIFTKFVAKKNLEIEELTTEVNTNAIGFEIPSCTEEYYDDEEDKYKHKIGF